MIGHQRDILASLGIDIWVPRAAVSQRLPASSLWRDQAAPELPSEIIVPVVAVATPQLKAELSQVREQPTAVVVTEKAAAVVAETPMPEVRSVLQIEAFSLEALQLPHCLILCESTHLTQAEQQLWRNIQQALSAMYHRLQWPFALAALQDGIGR